VWGENGVKWTNEEGDGISVRPMAGCVGERENVMSARVSSIIYLESKNGSGPRCGSG